MIDGRLEAILTVPSGVTLCNATNSVGGPTAITLTAGNYTPTQLCAHVQARLNALRAPANWTVTLSTGANGTGFVTINTSDTPFTITWVDTSGRDALGFTANLGPVSAAQTGTRVHRGLWLPDCPVTMDQDPERAPILSELRTTTSPNRQVYGLRGQFGYGHTNISWRAVSRAKAFENVSSIKGSWEQWFKDTQLGMDHAWFGVSSPFHIYTHAGVLVGADLNGGSGPVNGWRMSGVRDITPRRMLGDYWGLWEVLMPRIEAPE